MGEGAPQNQYITNTYTYQNKHLKQIHLCVASVTSHMHKSVHKSSVPDSYTLLLVIVKPYLFNVFCSHVRYVCMYRRGVMPIQSELSQDDFECSFQKTKNSRIFVIFDTITLVWLDHSVRHTHTASAAKFKSAFALWLALSQRKTFVQHFIITNHTRFCWA